MTAHDDLNAAVKAAQVEYKTAANALLACQMKLDATTHELQTAQAALAQAQLDLKACQDAANPPADGFETVPPGANLQAVLKEAGPGAKLDLGGKGFTLAGTITPWQEQHIRNGMLTKKVGANVGFGINCKTNDAVGVVLENLDASGFDLRGAVPHFGVTVKGGRYHHNGEMGIGCDGKGIKGEVITLDGVELDHNGKDSLKGHGAAGAKFFHLHKTKCVNVNSHDNIGNGLWWDAECGYADVIGGQVVGNDIKGVFWEKGGGNHGDGYVNPSGTPYAGGGDPYDGMLLVDGVLIKDNNQDFSLQGNAGVYCVGSKNMTVRNTTFGGNTTAIIVRNDQKRVDDDHAGWYVSNVTISDSTNTYNGDKVVVGKDATAGVNRV